MSKIRIKFTLNDKQRIAQGYLTDDVTTEVLFGGGAGGGKSFFGCLWLLTSCLKYPNTRWLMGRSKLKALRQTTLATFFDIVASCKMTQKHYTYNQQLGEITFYNGSVIILKDLFTYPSDRNFDSLGSLEITGAFIDEANQVSEKAKNIVSSRIRYKLEEYGLIPKLLMSCNPARNWTYSEFFKKSIDGKLEDYKQFVQALHTDNKHITKHYAKQLSKLDKASLRRLLLGQWELLESNSIINHLAAIEMFKDYAYTPIKPKYFISCDVARKGKDKAIIKVWDNYKVIETKSLAVSKVNELVDIITELKHKYKINNRSIVVDGDGVGGGVVDYLPGCIDFVNNSKALGKENYQNLKTQCYFKLADIINNGHLEIYGYTVEEKEALLEELAAIQQKNIDKDGKLQIKGKDEIKAEIGRSPDRADALMLRMYFNINPYTTQITFR